MKLLKLTLENFQGIRNFTFSPEGKNAFVYGTNASGKTTLYNAYTWLLFDKASTGAVNFYPETRDENGEVIHFIDHSVTGVFVLESGNSLELKKILSEDWTQKRGSDIKTFSGRKFAYYVDTLPVTKAQFDAKVSEILPPNLLAVLTQPFYFPETMLRQDRRTMLLQLFASSTEEGILYSDSSLAELLVALRKPDGTLHKVTDFKAAQEVKAASLNKEILPLPSRIDEAERAKAQNIMYTIDEANKVLAACADYRKQINEQISLISGNSGDEEIKREINRLTTEKQRLQLEHNQNNYQIESESKSKITKVSNDIGEAQRALENLGRLLLAAQRNVSALESRRSILAAKYSEIDKKTWNGDATCPACGQTLPADQVEEAVAKFNKGKSDELEAVRKEITESCSKAMIEEARKVVADAESDLEHMKTNINTLNASLAELRRESPLTTPFESTDECKSLTADINVLHTKLAAGGESTTQQKAALQAEFTVLDAKENEARVALMQISNTERQNKRIEELKAQSAQLAKEYEATQKLIYLCDQFTRVRAKFIDDEVNSQFTDVRFVMFKVQVNGGIQDLCDAFVRNGDGSWSSFSEANNAARINAGLEIIDAISRKLGKSLPIFIDNAESVVRVNPISAQMFLLIVSGNDEKLRVETY